MIVSPDKGVFFAATAVMCSAALYAAELSSPPPDPLRRVFVGVPNQLTLPPGFPDAGDAGQDDECDLRIADVTHGVEVQKTSSAVADTALCASEATSGPAPIVLPVSPSATKDERVVPDSLSTAVRAH